MSPGTAKERRRLFGEILVCFGPTLVFLPTGVLLVPHQLMLVIYDGVLSSLWIVFYYFGMVALLVALRAMYVFVTEANRRVLPPLASQLCLVCGVVALAIGPFGAFVLGGGLPIWGWLVFVILPTACVVHLVVKSKEYLLPAAHIRGARRTGSDSSPPQRGA